MIGNKPAVTHRKELLAALGPSGPDIRQLRELGEHNFNKKVDRAAWDAILDRRIMGRLALRCVQSYGLFMHGTPKTYAEIDGILRPNIPCRRDSKGRAYPMGHAAVCASEGDIEQPLRKALLHHDRPELQDVSLVLWRCKDVRGRPWHFTSQQALTRLHDTGATGMVAFWEDHSRIPPFKDEATGEIYLHERWVPHDVKVQQDHWTTVTLEDLVLDHFSGVPKPHEDLFVINASDQDIIKYLKLLPATNNFVQLADEMELSVTPLSGYYPSELHPLAITIV